MEGARDCSAGAVGRANVKEEVQSSMSYTGSLPLHFPPGYYFHPNEDEMALEYLLRVQKEPLPYNCINDVNLCGYNPKVFTDEMMERMDFSSLNYGTHLHLQNVEQTQEWKSSSFENLLAILDMDAPDSLEKITAQMSPEQVPIEQVQKRYEDLVDELKLIGSEKPHHVEINDGRARRGPVENMVRGTQAMQQRRKGVPWTADEHRLFLAGLKLYGKGDWRSISRNCVKSRTPTQVASHAQKYFIRLNRGTKDRRRASIHDMDIGDAPEWVPISPINSSGNELACGSYFTHQL